MPSLEFIKDVLASGGMEAFEFRIPAETLIAEKHYLDLHGPFRVEFRDCDSGWALVTPDELEAALNTLKNDILASEESAKNFLEKREVARKKFGQTTTIVATSL